MLRIGLGFGINRGGILPSTPAPSTDFIIRVKTDNAGTSASNQFTLPTTNIGVVGYDYNIDWGDGVVEDISVTTPQTHTYPTAGEYTITISGTFPRIFFNNGGDKSKVIETVNLGDVGWISMASAFSGCANNSINPTANIVLTVPTNFQSAWSGNNLTFFPALDMTLASSCFSTWANNKLAEFPIIHMPNVIHLEQAWQNNLLTTFPATNYPSCTNFKFTWDNNKLDVFENCDMSNGELFTASWRNNGVITSFVPRDFTKGTAYNSAWIGTTLPTSDYSDILVTQRANNVNINVSFHGGNSKYNVAGGIARGELTTAVVDGGQNWSITDGGAE